MHPYTYVCVKPLVHLRAVISSNEKTERLSFLLKGSFNNFPLTQYLNNGGKAARLQDLGRGGSW